MKQHIGTWVGMAAFTLSLVLATVAASADQPTTEEVIGKSTPTLGEPRIQFSNATQLAVAEPPVTTQPPLGPIAPAPYGGERPATTGTVYVILLVTIPLMTVGSLLWMQTVHAQHSSRRA